MAAKYAIPREPNDWRPPRPPRVDYRRTSNPLDGADYTPDEIEFMMAVEKYRRQHGPCKSQREALLAALRVAKELGYRKTTDE